MSDDELPPGSDGSDQSETPSDGTKPGSRGSERDGRGDTRDQPPESPDGDDPRTGGAADAGDDEEDDVPERQSSTSESGVPSEGRVVSDRFSADEVFQRIVAAADEEITSGRRELFFSGVAGGLAITITYLLYASMTASTDGDPILSVLLYPLGFIYIIIGGYQLYTENTLPPVALTLERLASLTALLRNWVVVLAGNFAGGLVGAIVLAQTGVLSPEAAVAAQDLAQKGIDTAWWDLFFKGAFAGLIVAGVVWVEYASRDTISRVLVIYLAFLAIPLGNLFHVVVSFTEMSYLLLLGEGGVVVGMVDFVIPVLLGNTTGGVVLVTIVNYYQTSENRLGTLTGSKQITRLSGWEWVFGGYVGRPYVPVIEHHDPAPATTDEAYRILLPISNPREEDNIVDLATEIASQHEGGTVNLTHMIQLPSRAKGDYGLRERERIRENSERQLAAIRDRYEGMPVHFETSTVVSYRSYEEMFNQARQNDSDLVVMGWGKGRHWDTLRSGRPLGELTSELPCDFLVMKDRGFDTSRILLPTAGGPDSGLSAEIAVALRESTGAAVSLLHVVDSPADRETGEQFLQQWAENHNLSDAEKIVDDSGQVEAAIGQESKDSTMVLIGATEQGMLRRLATDSLHLDVLERCECTVLLAERPYKRSLFSRLFGRGQRNTDLKVTADK